MQLIQNCLSHQAPYLDLGNCGITDLNAIPQLFDCIHLETLILSNEWWDWKQRKWVKSKNKGPKNNLKSLSPKIGQLKHLKVLIAAGEYNNKWTIVDISPLQNLSSLQNLDLSDNKIVDISPLQNLSSLQRLELRFNQIVDISPLQNLSSLQSLDLSDNKIVDISPLQNLSSLQSLYLYANQIVDISPLQNLSSLQRLNLSNNQIVDISPLQNLSSLQSLDLSDNKIVDISPLQNLSSLQSLYLYANQIVDISPLQNLSSLQRLNLSNNQIVDISPLQHLSSLQRLNLSDNKIVDISPLQHLSSLQSLNLSDNKIVDISLEFLNLGMEINIKDRFIAGLNLFNNPIKVPPMEILKQGREAAINWYMDKKRKLKELKIILLGDPKSGKTCLLKRLKDDDFDEKEAQTDGINIEDIAFGSSERFKAQKALHPFTGHFWDFGGQEIMNATHQFFLTKRTVYILVIDARKDGKGNMKVSNQIRTWLKNIRTTGGNSPLLVLANQIDVNPGFGFENEYELQQEFPQIQGFIKTSCKTKENIDAVKDRLAELIVEEITSFETEVNEKWIPIQKDLQSQTQRNNYLDEDTFLKTCRKHQLFEGQESAIQFFHDLGLVLHFNESTLESYNDLYSYNLANYYVLNPRWITYGVYQILTSKVAGKAKGIIAQEEVQYIINEEEDKKIDKTYHAEKIHYDFNERRFLVDILKQFKLCFSEGKRIIVPDLLDSAEPSLATNPIRKNSESLQFIYDYDALPKSTMPHIMVSLHTLLINRWRTGCILAYKHEKNTQALIISYANKIRITVVGEHKRKREFLAFIRGVMDSTVNDKLVHKPRKCIPLPDTTVLVDYDELLEREKDGDKYYVLYKPIKKKFEIVQLLEGVPTEDEVLEEIKKLREDVKKGNQKIINNQEMLKDSLDKIENLNKEKAEALKRDILNFIADSFEILDSNSESAKKLSEIHQNILKAKSDINMKLKIGLPLISMLGINFETEIDVKSWMEKMYHKYKLSIFKNT